VRDVLGSAAGVLFPVFARLQNNPERLRATYLAGVQLAAVIVFPALTLIAVAAPVLIPWLLGPEWQPAVLPAQILACGGLREATAMLNGPVFRARGRPGLHTLFQACGTACYLVAFWVGLDFGSAGVAFFYVLTGLLLWPVSLWLVLGVLGESFGRWWHALAPVGAATGIMAVASAIVLHLTRQSWGVGSLVMLLLTGMVAGVVYLGVLGLLVPDFLLWVASLFWEVVAGWAAVE
jgi:lipopolysaccharide exporter